MIDDSKPLISVLIPVFNVEKYIKLALESISNQTYRNLEIIVVDDGSIDKTYDLCVEVAKNDNRFVICKNEANMGIVDTLNYAYSIAKGEYIARMDGDDISELDRLEKQFNFLSQNRQYALVGVSLIGIDHFGNEISKFKHISSWSLISRTLMFVTPVSHVWLAHKYLYDRLKGYRNIPGAEDYDFLLRAKSCGYQFSNVPNYFGYRVRINREGNTHSLLGLSQRLMFQYSYDLYKERMSNGTDSYSKRVLQKILGYSKYRASIYSYSANCLSRAIIYRADGRYFLMLVYIIYSLISLDMIKYYYQRFMLKVALEFNLREEM